MNLKLRLETPQDYRAVEELTRDAFWGTFQPTCEEHYLVHLLRDIPAFVPELDYVAQLDGQLVGNIMYSKAKVTAADGKEHQVLTFGPLSVPRAHWRSGIGGTLLTHTMDEARRLGYAAIIIFGHPSYYTRHGFKPAREYGITAPGGASPDALMALPLYEGALAGITGVFHEDAAFALVTPEAAAAFDKGFPYREPAEMVPISLLLDRLPAAAREAFVQHEVPDLFWLNRVSRRELLEWEDIDPATLEIINQVLTENGMSPKR